MRLNSTLMISLAFVLATPLLSKADTLGYIVNGSQQFGNHQCGPPERFHFSKSDRHNPELGSFGLSCQRQTDRW